METMMIGFSLIVAIGALAQLFAWRFDLPAIIIMTVAGVLVGPVFGWIAPRGIVAMTVTGFFAAEITELGVTDAEKMLPLTLGLVFLSVTIHGLTIKPLAKRLGLKKTKNPLS